MRWLPLILTVLALLTGWLWFSSELADHERRIGRCEETSQKVESIRPAVMRIDKGVSEVIPSLLDRMTKVEAAVKRQPIYPPGK